MKTDINLLDEMTKSTEDAAALTPQAQQLALFESYIQDTAILERDAEQNTDANDLETGMKKPFKRPFYIFIDREKYHAGETAIPYVAISYQRPYPVAVGNYLIKENSIEETHRYNTTVRDLSPLMKELRGRGYVLLGTIGKNHISKRMDTYLDKGDALKIEAMQEQLVNAHLLGSDPSRIYREIDRLPTIVIGSTRDSYDLGALGISAADANADDFLDLVDEKYRKTFKYLRKNMNAELYRELFLYNNHLKNLYHHVKSPTKLVEEIKDQAIDSLLSDFYQDEHFIENGEPMDLNDDFIFIDLYTYLVGEYEASLNLDTVQANNFAGDYLLTATEMNRQFKTHYEQTDITSETELYESFIINETLDEVLTEEDVMVDLRLSAPLL